MLSLRKTMMKHNFKSPLLWDDGPAKENFPRKLPFEDPFSILTQYQKLYLEDRIVPSMLLPEYGCCTINGKICQHVIKNCSPLNMSTCIAEVYISTNN
jgi:hypothetical protein